MNKYRTALVYVAMLGAAVGIFFCIYVLGGSIHAPEGSGIFGQHAPRESGIILTHVLLALVVVILCARGLGWAFRRLNQPPVVAR